MTGSGDECAGRLWDKLEKGFALAAQARPDAVRTLDIGMAGHQIRLVVVGPGLADYLGGALAHLTLQESAQTEMVQTTPDLTISLWDRTVAESAWQPFTLDMEGLETDQFGGGLLFRTRDGALLGRAAPSGVAMIAPAGGAAFGMVRGTDSLNARDATKPLIEILFPWFIQRGTVPIHAGCNGVGRHGLLYAGPSGSGKSTLSVLGVAAGLSFLGDDYMLLNRAPDGDGIDACSHSCTAFLDAAHAADRLPEFSAAMLPVRGVEGSDKRAFRLAPTLPCATIQAIVLPVRTTGTPRLRPATPGEALRRIAPSTVVPTSFLPSRPILEMIGRLVLAVPCYWLDSGADIRALRDLLPTLLPSER